MFQRDYILRIVDQVAQAVARAIGLLTQHKLEEAERELAAGYSALGIPRELIGVLDAATFARQLGDDDRITAAVRLLVADAQLCAGRADRLRAEQRLRLADRLLAHLAEPRADLRSDVADARRTLLGDDGA